MKKSSLCFGIPKATIYLWKDKEKNKLPKIQNNEATFEKKVIRKIKNIYTYEFKKEIISYFYFNGEKKTLAEFKISRSSLLTWRKQFKEGTLSHEKNVVIFDRTVVHIQKLINADRNHLLLEVEITNKQISLTNINNYSYPMRYRMIFNLKDLTFTIETLCKTFSVDRSGYYKWIKRGMPISYNNDDYLCSFIKEIRNEGKDYWGIRRIQREILIRHGAKYSLYKINKYLKFLDLETIITQRKRYYKKRNYSEFVIENLLIDNETHKKNFEPTGVNQLWLADASSLLNASTHSGHRLKVYTIMDAYDRFIIGYVFWEGKLAGENFYKLFDKCIKEFGIPDIFHTDRGPEFLSHEILHSRSHKMGFKMSHNRPRRPTDNGRMERFYKTMKVENRYFLKQDVNAAKNHFHTWVNDYNWNRYHSVLETNPSDKGKRKKKQIFVK